MPNADFAAAQQRLAARRRARDQEAQARVADRSSSRTAESISKLPRPLKGLGVAGLTAWDAIKGREGTGPAFRVGQVDAELLDEELLELLRGQVGEGVKYLGSNIATDYAAEIGLLLRAALFKLSIWDHDASYGASLQGLRYIDARQSPNSRAPTYLSPPTSTQKVLYGLISVLGRYGWTKWEDHLLEQESSYEEPTPRMRVLSRLTTHISTAHTLLALPSFLLFLLTGRHRTLLDRVLRLRLAPASTTTTRDVSFEYLNRQLVWHAFTEFLLFLLPLVGVRRWRRLARRGWRGIVNAWRALRGFGTEEDDEKAMTKDGVLGFLPERTCGICYADQTPGATGGAASEADIVAASSAGGGGVVGSALTDVTNPYEAIPCGCVYCFACIAQKIESEEGEGWTCLRCGEIVKACRPWRGEVVEEKDGARSSDGAGKSVGFADMERGEKSGQYESLKGVDPLPIEDDESSYATMSRHTTDMNDSSEWARASEIVREEDEQVEDEDEEKEEDDDEEEEEFDTESEDLQSEGYDEDEDEEEMGDAYDAE
ncbi:hypothetical protein P152DRAFT_470227 [Eremomyces bilateralis CBS 781.70]|uniref:Pex N-terminal domain-containing protein n=1 Tax=Eremomyces bilateralis CBS 781.70 TaxID=1392243 RepID=A0A6G1GDU4_9PEZI|nr:uncharacterized protein P152DRAFT_470227 [Eremomyces bilateralis CBS 781.70]KAF1816184.1 hypothetical protein P152DRAFT_470227 [Eremomyces bilateralis CBS 781.70]